MPAPESSFPCVRRSAGLRRRRWKPFAVPHQHLPARSDESRPLRGPALDSFHHGDCRATHTRVAVNLITNRITQELEPDPTLQVAWARAACSRSFNANLGAPHRSAQSFRAASVPVTLASGTSRACRCGILRKATVGLTADSVLTPVADHRLKSLQTCPKILEGQVKADSRRSNRSPEGSRSPPAVVHSASCWAAHQDANSSALN